MTSHEKILNVYPNVWEHPESGTIWTSEAAGRSGDLAEYLGESWDSAASKLPPGSPAGETASEPKCACTWSCMKCEACPDCEGCDCERAVPEPVPTEVACDCIHGNFCMAKQGTLIPGFYCRLTTSVKSAAPIAPAAEELIAEPTMEGFEEWWTKYLAGREVNPFPDKASLWNAKQASWSSWHAALARAEEYRKGAKK